MSSKGLREIRNPPFAQNCGKHNKDVWGCGYALTCKNSDTMNLVSQVNPVIVYLMKPLNLVINNSESSGSSLPSETSEPCEPSDRVKIVTVDTI